MRRRQDWGFHIFPPLASPCLPHNTALGDFPQLPGPLSLWAGRAGIPSPSISLKPVQTVSCARGEAGGGAWGELGVVGVRWVLGTPEQGLSGLDEQVGPELRLAERRGGGSL